MAQQDETTNPFRFGDLALDEAFTDRGDELRELTSDIRNGQNVVLFAPRRFGKSSLLWRAAQQLVRSRSVLIAQVDLMKTPTKQRFAEKLATSIYEDIASTLFKVRDRAAGVFAGLRVAPTMTLDTDGSLSFSFTSGYAPTDLDATIEHLLQLPAELGADRRRRVALVFDEFQEIVKIDPGLLPLMRSVFQEQPDVAHVYLGSKRHIMEQIFNDENEPFWRSAKQMELGIIPRAAFASFIRARFEQTSRSIDDDAVAALLDTTRSHPYGTQELAYALWESTAAGATAEISQLEEALARVLRSENAHFDRIWDQAARGHRVTLEALANEPGGQSLSSAYRRRHDLPAPSTVQKALQALIDDELVERDADGHRIAEPFLAEWILRNGI
jgi:hypothetical protein